MRTAEEIVIKVGEFTQKVLQKKYRNKATINIDEATEMINDARKETIEECAKVASLEIWSDAEARIVDIGKSFNVKYGQRLGVYAQIHRQSILKLINELK